MGMWNTSLEYSPSAAIHLDNSDAMPPVLTLPCKLIGILVKIINQQFFNPGSNHVKIPIKKEHFF